MIEFVDDKLSIGVDCRRGLTLKLIQELEEENSLDCSYFAVGFSFFGCGVIIGFTVAVLFVGKIVARVLLSVSLDEIVFGIIICSFFRIVVESCLEIVFS